MVPPWCILNGGTVPPRCILNGGTVPPWCILNGGTVPPFNLFLNSKWLRLPKNQIITKSNQTKPKPIKPSILHQTKQANQTKPNQTKPNKSTKPNQTNQTKHTARDQTNHISPGNPAKPSRHQAAKLPDYRLRQRNARSV